MHSLWFTAAFTVATVILINVLAYMVALLLTRGFQGHQHLSHRVLLPNLIGGIILGYIWQLIFNGVLANFGRTLTYSSTYGFWGWSF